MLLIRQKMTDGSSVLVKMSFVIRNFITVSITLFFEK